MRQFRLIGSLMTALVILASCASPSTPPGASQPAPASDVGPQRTEPSAPQAPRRIVAAIQGEPVGFHTKLERRSSPGGDAIEALAHSGLAVVNNDGQLVPALGEEVPSTENGLWVVHPDGRMETTWRIKAGASWHDGTPLTSDDLAFAVQVGMDRNLPTFGSSGFRSVESVETVDQRTVTVYWSRPYIDADSLFATVLALPLPQHLLGKTYAEEKDQFTQVPYWTTDFVGTGPFRLRDWEPGSHAVLEANQRYVLGRPKIDEIEIRFILEPTTLAANLLSGAVEMTMGRNLSLEEALVVRDQWQSGSAVIVPRSLAAIWPQFINSDPAIIGDVRFRRALLHAVDRSNLVDTFMAGMVPVAHSFLSPSPRLAEVQGRLPQYEFDTRKAAQMIEALGYTKGPDGMFRGGSGQPLALELRTTAQLDIQPKTTYAVADMWQRLGIATTPLVVPNQRVQDQAYRVTFPAFSLIQQGNDRLNLLRFHTSQIALPENNFVGRNRPRYSNAEMDALLDRFQTTIPVKERSDVVGQIIYHIADQLPAMGLFYGTQVTFVGSRIGNVKPGPDTSTSWNAHTWEVK